MINSDLAKEILSGIQSNDIVPYLGPGVLSDVKSVDGNTPIPADSDSLILAMNDGQPMAPRLMYEFPRAAMNLELKKGRKFVELFLTETYGNKQWGRGKFHDWLAEIKPQYVIDINRDTQLQESYSATPHLLIVGCARLGGTDYRFKLYQHDGNQYKVVEQEEADTSLPIVFKPMGTPSPEPSYIAADADYVDYITELMGGFAIPSFLKTYRQEKQYFFAGIRMTRDTERMVLSDIVYGASKPTGWAIIPEPTDKERRFCKTKKIEIIESDWESFVEVASSLVETA